MADTFKKYILLGVLVSGLALVLYAMPESIVMNDSTDSSLHLSGNMNH